MHEYPLFANNPTLISTFLQQPFLTVDQAQNAADRHFEKITDQNMVAEFKYRRDLH